MVVIAIVASGEAAAAVRSVGAPGSGCGYTSVAAAVSASSPGDTIAVRPGTWPSPNILVDHDLDFLPADVGCAPQASAGTVTLTGSNSTEVMRIDLADVTFRNFHFVNGQNTTTDTGILQIDSASVTFTDAHFRGGSGTYGGAVAMYDSFVIFTGGDTVFEDNVATGGGALYVWESSVFVLDAATFEDNAAFGGGAILSMHSTVEIDAGDDDTSFTGNQADGDGGAVWVNDAAAPYALLIHASTGSVTFEGNTANGDGGAVYLEDDDGGEDVRLENVIGTANTAANGGFLFLEYPELAPSTSTLTIIDSELVGNQADVGIFGDGGALCLAYALPVEIEGTLFEGNFAHLAGGAIRFEGELDITDSVISMNEAGALGGGGLFSDLDDAGLRISDSFILDNKALGGGDGGGVHAVFAHEVTLTNVELARNTASSGGAMFLEAVDTALVQDLSSIHDNGGSAIFLDASVLEIDRSTLSDNLGCTVGCGAAVHVDADSSLTITNSLVTRNSDATDQEPALKTVAGALEIRATTIAMNSGRGVAWAGAAVGAMTQSIDQLNGSGSAIDPAATVNVLCNDRATLIGTPFVSVGNQNDTTNLFVNTGTDDYHLTSTSPALNQCNSGLYTDFRPDFDSNAANGWFDQGAYERQ